MFTPVQWRRKEDIRSNGATLSVCVHLSPWTTSVTLGLGSPVILCPLVGFPSSFLLLVTSTSPVFFIISGSGFRLHAGRSPFVATYGSIDKVMTVDTDSICDLRLAPSIRLVSCSSFLHVAVGSSLYSTRFHSLPSSRTTIPGRCSSAVLIHSLWSNSLDAPFLFTFFFSVLFSAYIYLQFGVKFQWSFKLISVNQAPTPSCCVHAHCCFFMLSLVRSGCLYWMVFHSRFPIFLHWLCFVSLQNWSNFLKQAQWLIFCTRNYFIHISSYDSAAYNNFACYSISCFIV